MPAPGMPPELVDAVRAFTRIARALADYLEAVAEVERSYGVGVEELLRRVFESGDRLAGLPTSTLMALYEAAVGLRAAADMLSRLSSLAPEEKAELATTLRRIAERLEAVAEAGAGQP